MSGKKFKLLNKAMLAYISIYLIAFLLSGWFLMTKSDQLFNRIVENKFQRIEENVSRRLNTDFPIDSLNPNWSLSKITHLADTVKYPAYRSISRFDVAQNTNINYRVKETVIQAKGHYYLLTINHETELFHWFKFHIIRILIPTALILILALLIINYVLSQRIFKPFFRILQEIQLFKIGRQPKYVATSTKEFDDLQQMLHSMTHRIESDYRHLKEYNENMAHEIQTPLAIIQNKLSFLINTNEIMKLSSKEIKCIADEVNYLSKLSESLNLLSKIENKEFISKSKIKTREVIEKHLELFEDMAEAKGMCFDIDLDPKQKLFIHPYLLDIILVNLIKNAIRHAPTNSTISIHSKDNQLSISNTGTELPFPAEKVFDRFQKSNHSRYSLGLGLAVVKQACEINQLSITYSYHNQRHVFNIKAYKNKLDI